MEWTYARKKLGRDVRVWATYRFVFGMTKLIAMTDTNDHNGADQVVPEKRDPRAAERHREHDRHAGDQAPERAGARWRAWSGCARMNTPSSEP